MQRAGMVALAVWLAALCCGAAAAEAANETAAHRTTVLGDVVALHSLRASLTRVPSDWEAFEDPCGLPTCNITPPNACSWSGLSCRDSRVTAVFLPCLRDLGLCFGLGGSLPPGLAGATALELIELTGNAIVGTLPPQWGSLRNLTVLSTAYNQLSGVLPPEFGNLTSLELLWLSGNKNIRSELPASWGKLSQLQDLRLGSMAVFGGFPGKWSGLQKLKYLDLSGNTLVGSLPASWMRMYALQVLDLRQQCGVCGVVPFNQAVKIGDTGTSLGWPCGKGNCSGLPLGFLGQAVIISAVLLVLFALCLWRRVFLFRRHGSEGQRSGFGLVRAALTRRPPRPPPRPGMLHTEESAAEAAATQPPAPPVVVLQPDMQFCTARMDAEWAAAGDLPLSPKAGGEPQASPTQRSWRSKLRAMFRGGLLDRRATTQQPAAPAAPLAAGQSVEMAAALQLQRSADGAGASSTDSSSRGSTEARQQAAVPQVSSPQPRPGSAAYRLQQARLYGTGRRSARPGGSTAAVERSSAPPRVGARTSASSLSSEDLRIGSDTAQPGGSGSRAVDRSNQQQQRRQQYVPRREIVMYDLDFTAQQETAAPGQEHPQLSSPAPPPSQAQPQGPPPP